MAFASVKCDFISGVAVDCIAYRVLFPQPFQQVTSSLKLLCSRQLTIIP